MFFALSKTLDLLLSPLVWALILISMAMLAKRARRLESASGASPRKSEVPVCYPAHGPRWWPRPGTRLRRGADLLDAAALPLACVILYVFSMEVVSNRLVRALEIDAPDSKREGQVYDAVILLGGLVLDRVDTHNGVSYNENVERLHGTYDVLARGEAKRAILSGGSWADTTPEAVTLADELVRMGIARERLLIEERSRNTRENALYTAEIVRREGMTSLLLVTSAFHMQRSLGCFEAVGLHPDTMPVDYKSYDPARFRGSFLPRTTSLDNSTMALRELAGRVVYRLTGR